MSVRIAEPKDLMTVFEFRKSLCEEERGEKMEAHEICELMQEVSGAMLPSGPTILFVELLGQPVGSVWCYGQPLAGKNDGKTMRVDMLYLIPPSRKNKYLRELWDAVHALADEYQIERLQGFVSESNRMVRRMWERRGAYVRGVILEKKHGRTRHISKGRDQESGASVCDSSADRPRAT